MILTIPAGTANQVYRYRVPETRYTAGAVSSTSTAKLSSTKVSAKLSKKSHKRGSRAVAKLTIKTTNAHTGTITIYDGKMTIGSVKVKNARRRTSCPGR